jgi:thiamine biosynthesis lipoprotein
MTYETATFQAMGTEIELLAAPMLDAETVEQIRLEFEHVEARLSRFRPDSELSRLNSRAGEAFAASPMLLQVLREALYSAEESDGLFDPVVLRAVEAAGYRESIEQVRGSTQVQTLVRRPATYRNVSLVGGMVRIPEGAGIDLGGFAKGWTVDRAVALMDGDNWVINAGGDLLARGDGPDGGGWIVGIEDVFAPANDVAVVRLENAALATSSTMRRRWRTQDGAAHHLIDPRTQRPSETDIVSVSVIAPTTARAEVLAKTLLLRGSIGLTDYLSTNEVATVVMNERGVVTITPAMERYLVA